MVITYGSISSPRSGFCASNITFSRITVNATGRGCISDSGLGKGELTTGCAGSGASHGGMGGYGSSDQDLTNAIKNCSNAVNGPYSSDGEECLYEGSGGASGMSGQSYGGNGGGVIWLSTPNTFIVYNSSVIADGLPGIAPPSQLLG